jgi:hypothetical protein
MEFNLFAISHVNLTIHEVLGWDWSVVFSSYGEGPPVLWCIICSCG